MSPEVEIAVDCPLGMQQFERLDQPPHVAPHDAARPGLANLSQEFMLSTGGEEQFQGTSQSRIENEVEAVVVLTAANHTDKEIVGTRQCCKTLKLAYLASPDQLQILIVLPFLPRPEFHKYIICGGTPPPQYTRPTACAVRLQQIGIVNGVG